MFLDTSGLLSLAFRGEPSHTIATAHFTRMTPKYTTDFVVMELVALAQARRYPRPAILDFVDALVAHPLISIVDNDSELLHRALALLRRRPDKTYSLCDAASFLVMHDFGVSEALTTDQHFEQEGFRRLLLPV